MTFVEDAAAGTTTLRDGGKDVLTYRYGDQLKPGASAVYTRASYIHPLYGLDGRVLTEDSPPDHLHHHGLFWAWPVVKVRDMATSNWEPGRPPLRQVFFRWAAKSASSQGAELEAENDWVLDGKETVAREIVLEAVGGPLAHPKQLRGDSQSLLTGPATRDPAPGRAYSAELQDHDRPLTLSRPPK